MSIFFDRKENRRKETPHASTPLIIYCFFSIFPASVNSLMLKMLKQHTCSYGKISKTINTRFVIRENKIGHHPDLIKIPYKTIALFEQNVHCSDFYLNVNVAHFVSYAIVRNFD